MTTQDINLQIPAIFQKLNTYESEDSRFLKVKIWLMHLQENLNGSFFSKEVVEDALPTLANTPILGFIEQRSDGEDDFSDHRNVLAKEDGKYKVKYIGQAYGVIPETNNAQFEKRVCDDGVEREFLTVEGLVWQKNDDPIEILERDIVKSQSMELHHDLEGEFKEDNLFHFTKFKFFGACILGENTLPAMRSSTVEVQFSYDNFKSDIQVKMEEFKSLKNENELNINQIVTNFSQEGGSSMEEKIKLLSNFNLVPSQLNFSIDELTLEELEEKLKDFTLTAEQFRDEIKTQLRKEKVQDDWGWEYSRYSYVDYKENMVFAIDRKEDYVLIGMPFTVSGDSVSIDFEATTRYKYDFVPFENGQSDMMLYTEEIVEHNLKVKEKEVLDKFEAEKTEAVKVVQEQLDTITSEFETLKEKATKLEEYYTSNETEKVNAEKDVLFTEYDKVLKDVVEYQDLKEKREEHTVESLEKELALMFARKNIKFSKTKPETTIKVNVENKDNQPKLSPYGDLF